MKRLIIICILLPGCAWLERNDSRSVSMRFESPDGCQCECSYDRNEQAIDKKSKLPGG